MEIGIMSVGREDGEWRGEGVEAAGTEGAEGVGSLESNVGEWYEVVTGDEVGYAPSKEGWLVECR